MYNENEKIEKLKKDFELGVLDIKNISEEDLNKVIKFYENEIENNKKEIKETQGKIKNLKKKIDDII